MTNEPQTTIEIVNIVTADILAIQMEFNVPNDEMCAILTGIAVDRAVQGGVSKNEHVYRISIAHERSDAS